MTLAKDFLALFCVTDGPALAHHPERSALSVSCEGSSVSLELVKLLIDDDGLVLSAGGMAAPLWAILYNSGVSSFPVDVFKYLFNQDPSAFLCVDLNSKAEWN